MRIELVFWSYFNLHFLVFCKVIFLFSLNFALYILDVQFWNCFYTYFLCRIGLWEKSWFCALILTCPLLYAVRHHLISVTFGLYILDVQIFCNCFFTHSCCVVLVYEKEVGFMLLSLPALDCMLQCNIRLVWLLLCTQLYCFALIVVCFVLLFIAYLLHYATIPPLKIIDLWSKCMHACACYSYVCKVKYHDWELYGSPSG